MSHPQHTRPHWRQMVNVSSIYSWTAWYATVQRHVPLHPWRFPKNADCHPQDAHGRWSCCQKVISGSSTKSRVFIDRPRAQPPPPPWFPDFMGDREFRCHNFKQVQFQLTPWRVSYVNFLLGSPLAYIQILTTWFMKRFSILTVTFLPATGSSSNGVEKVW